MPEQRRYSREYLAIVLKRKVRLRDCFAHFLAVTDSLVLKLQVARDPKIASFRLSPEGETGSLTELLNFDGPVLFGTFHVGNSDLLGCMLSEFGRPIRMVRERVGNDDDMAALERTFGDVVEFVWVNQRESMLFALKSVVDDGASIALQCDRVEYGARHHLFNFLGAKRSFPVTIYHLAYLFKMPVSFSFAIPVGSTTTQVVCSELFVPQGKSKREVLEAGYMHFQQVLTMLEEVLYEHPYAWFNFRPLNSESLDDAS